MIQLFMSILVSLPCFSSVLQSEGAQSITYSRETDNGYLILGSLSDGWGGVPHLVIYTMDQYGVVISQTEAAFTGEPARAADFQDGAVVVCTDGENNVSRVAYFDNTGSEQWLSILPGGALGNAAVRATGSDFIVAGNDSEAPRVARFDNLGNLLWNVSYPAMPFSVRDVCSYNGEIFVLGTAEEPGWQSNVCLLVLNDAGGVLELHTLFSGEGRLSPEAIEVDSRGLFILLNAMTDLNNMIFETRLLKLNFSLETIWTGSLSGSSWERGSDMVTLGNGGFGVCGWTNSLPLSESNRSDMVLAEFDENGQTAWRRTHGTSSTDYGLSLSAVSDGGFLVSGCVTEALYKGWLVKTDSLGLLEPQGVSDFQPPAFSAVPLSNPLVNGMLSFTVNTSDSRVIHVSVYDMAGRTVAGISRAVAAGANQINLNTDVPSGVYSVRVSSDKHESIFRAVVCGGAE
ncbi:MAG: T9SS type A sorting domain-containing protein [Candidatus Sabulitectum sp.]|nr:T9SS type A sorting domain-containing protein [Candidatus Sabulitectum sp.]